MFYFRLALALGMTVGELLGRASGRELTEWTAYYKLEPFGEERADVRAGVVASVIANVHRGKNRPFRPTDFMVFRDPAVVRAEQEREAERDLERFFRAREGRRRQSPNPSAAQEPPAAAAPQTEEG